MRVRVLLAVVSVALLGFAPAPFPKAERQQREDQADVVGTWEFTLWEYGGKRARRNEDSVYLRLTKDRFDFVSKKTGQEGEGYVIRLDPAASPPAFTLRLINRPERVELVGSYRLKRDQLTLIFAEGERVEQRPTDFSGKSDYRIELRRIRRD